jgi:mercuric ion transport protein
MVEPLNHLPQVPRRSGFGWAALAALTCPCHVPLLALLFAGTAAGAFLDQHLSTVLALMSVVFVPALGLAIRRLNQSGAESRASAQECNECERNGLETESRAARPAAHNAR